VKVLATLTYYYPHWTGLTAVARYIAEGLAARGHQVTVLTSRFRRDLPSIEVVNGVRVIRLPTLMRVSRGMVMPTYPLAAWKLIRTHDLVQFHTPMLESWLITLLADLAGKPSLMTHHGDLVMPAGLFNRLVEKTVTYQMRWAQRRADWITAYTRDYAEHSVFLRPFLDKIVCIHPPVEFPRPNLDAAAAWRGELGLDRCRTVGFAGRWVEEKGFDVLLEAIPLVRKQITNVKFVYAGEVNVVYERFFDRCRPLLEAQRDHVVILGLILDRQRLAQFYALCDVFALPSRSDNFALTQVEAMLCGTPVVATDIPGARVAVKTTGMGVLVRPRNPESLAAGLVEVLSNRERYVRPYELIRSIFDPQQAISAYEDLMLKLARR